MMEVKYCGNVSDWFGTLCVSRLLQFLKGRCLNVTDSLDLVDVVLSAVLFI